MRRIITLALAGLLAVGMTLALTSCQKEKDTLVCGITDFDPMNYRDNSGEWTGFDTELAKLVGEKLNMTVKFQEIQWDSKYMELESGAISCIWNGFTANATESDDTPRSDKVDFSYCYMLNQQSIVIKADRASEFTSADSLLGMTAAAESGSAGEGEAAGLVGEDGSVLGVSAQVNTLLEVKAGAVDCAVIDILLAERLAGTGDYSDLMIADITLGHEFYAIGFPKGSDLTDKVDKALKELYDAGKMMELAEKYGLQDSLILETFRG